VGSYRKSELIATDVCDWVEGHDHNPSGVSLGVTLNERRQKNRLGP
jgi:hypothetical protein